MVSFGLKSPAAHTQLLPRDIVGPSCTRYAKNTNSQNALMAPLGAKIQAATVIFKGRVAIVGRRLALQDAVGGPPLTSLASEQVHE